MTGTKPGSGLRELSCAIQTTGRVRRVVSAGVCTALVGGLSLAWCAPARAEDAPRSARTHAKRTVELSPWEQAEQGRDTLESIPEDQRTRADYTRAMDLYRAIYHGDPAEAHAPAAVNAVAELLAEQGRTLHDAKSLKAAVGQYEFLRKQYPASSLDVAALLAEAQIEQNDLGDAAAAREKYQLLLKDHPKSEHADEARAGLESLDEVRGSRAEVRGKAGRATAAPDASDVAASQQVSKSASQRSPVTASQEATASRRSDASPLSQSNASSLPPMPRTGASASNRDDAASSSGAGPLPVPAGRTDAGAVLKPKTGGAISGESIAAVDAETRPAGADAGQATHSGKRALVTGIRHWSTANYTRVAIDLGDNVTYEAARVPNPDRIYFDLHGTRLSPELVGKSFSVTDDGFLKKVRAAQYSDDVTRIVLDVNDVTEYSAFLLPNPYRLIIDIHGAKQGAASRQVAAAGNRDQGAGNSAAATANGAAAANDVPAPRAAAVVRATPARPVPNSVATKSSPTEVADLSDAPGRVDATKKPTSKPIAAVVTPGSNSETRGANAASPADASIVGDSTASGATASTPATNATGISATNATGAANAVTAPAGANPLSAAGGPASPSKKTRKGRAKSGDATADAASAAPARAAVPTADGETSLVRALGLKIGRIVIDAGHGGHDSGTIGVDGLEEKDVVLDVALRLGKLLHDRLGAEIIYTRSDDTFIPLETRTAIANKAQADLFISIHANSSPDASARGVETYYLNFTSDPTALDVAARENAVSDQSIHQLSDLVKKIALKDKIEESHEFASDVETSLYSGLQKGNSGLKDRGVKKAPFVVLIGANMPSILAEISFVTNPKDADQLRDPEYRERVAESLYRGVARYEGGLSGGTHLATERAAVGQ